MIEELIDGLYSICFWLRILFRPDGWYFFFYEGMFEGGTKLD